MAASVKVVTNANGSDLKAIFQFHAYMGNSDTYIHYCFWQWNRAREHLFLEPTRQQQQPAGQIEYWSYTI